MSSVVNKILGGNFGAEAWGLAWLKGVTAGLKQVGEIVSGFFESGIRLIGAAGFSAIEKKAG